MRVNLERTTFLLSRLKVGLSSKPEVIEIKPPAGSPDPDHSYYSYGSSHEKSSDFGYDHGGIRTRKPSNKSRAYVVAPSTMERMDSTSTNNSSNTQFSLDVELQLSKTARQPRARAPPVREPRTAV